ncbi:MAG: hypothetical protein IJV93_05920 [Lentisphaeria bacterium]|nr:hypothetical protein [Lentisphaeria bacterium]
MPCYLLSKARIICKLRPKASSSPLTSDPAPLPGKGCPAEVISSNDFVFPGLLN